MISHLPTLMIIIGYAVFWLELYVFRLPAGKTTLLATIMFAVISGVVISRNWFRVGLIGKNVRAQWSGFQWFTKIFIVLGCSAVFSILACAFYASLLPPHLAQETDALIYHITLPRQHLIRHSFEAIPWSTADFYLLPVNFALAPYWLVTSLPNKIPQFLFFLGFIVMSARLVGRWSSHRYASVFLVIFAVAGSHHVGIQAGTAMLDVTMAYLLLAALDSFLKGNALLCGVELAFYFWSKSFVPVQSVLIVLALFPLGWMLYRQGWKMSWVPGVLMELGAYKKNLNQVLLTFVAGSILIGGPFVIKSLKETGSPLFPFYPGLIKTQPMINSDAPAWQSIVQKAKEVRATRDQYGSDRSPSEFLKHLWLIAVPEKGVNNRYDYPVGLMYLLFVVPFFVFWIQSLRAREFSLIPFFILAFWATWWMGTHQTRFLILPTTMMLIVSAAKIEKLSKILMLTVMTALALTVLSVLRAHQADWGRSVSDVVRDKDKNLLEMAKTLKPGEMVELDYIDVAFAEFPVNVSGLDSVFVLKK